MPEVKFFSLGFGDFFGAMSPCVDNELSTGYVGQSYSVHYSRLNSPDYTAIFKLNLPNKAGKKT